MLSRECSAPLLVTHWVSHVLPILPSSQFLFFTPLCPTWGHSSGFNICLRKFLHSFIWFQDFPSRLLTSFTCLSATSCAHLVSVPNFPPVPLITLPKLPAFIGFQYLYFPRSLPTTSCAHLVFFCLSFLPGAPQQLPAFILLQYPRCPSATSCIHLVLYLVPPWPPKVPLTCASQPLAAFMRFQYLYKRPPSSLHSFLHAPSFGFNI